MEEAAEMYAFIATYTGAVWTDSDGGVAGGGGI